MRIEIISKNYKCSEKLKEIIERKLEKFSRYFDEETNTKVVLKEVNGTKCVMEITIHYSGGIMRSEVTSETMYENIDIALPKLERQVRKHRTKLGKKIKESGFNEEAIYGYKEEKPLSIARVKPTELKKMNVKDAIEEMELLDHSFYAFINDTSGLVNIVYKREAGDAGLLDLIY